MGIELDHVFVSVRPGAPEAESLCAFGLTEGPPNHHPGQGTSCRRFFFRNAMLELIWMRDEEEARSAATERTLLCERFGSPTASPFGFILRPTTSGPSECPFPNWIYQPPSMPDLRLRVSTAPVNEPMWCCMDIAPRRRVPPDHPIGFRELTGVRLIAPALAEDTVTMQMARLGINSFEAGPAHLLVLEFDHGQEKSRSFSPEMPLAIQGAISCP